MRDRLIELLQNVPTDYAGNRGIGTVADYLLENGVIVLPCKVGQVVYAVFGNSIIEATVAQITIEPFEVSGMSFHCFGGYNFDMRHLDETVFFTREEAERVLKGGAKE